MRPMLVLAALLAAVPASAQGLDTRVDDATETADGFTCRAHALPDLRLSHDWRDADRSAVLDIAGRETTAATYIHTTFKPDTDAPFGTAAEIQGFQFDMDRAPLRADPKVAHLRIDGTSDPMLLTVDGNRTSLSISITERLRGELATRLMHASIVEIDLVDATAAVLGRFSWDVRSLRRAPELLQIINWSCR
jgi:hypothetical protein